MPWSKSRWSVSRILIAAMAAAMLFATATPSSAWGPRTCWGSCLDGPSDPAPVRSGTADAADTNGSLYNVVDQVGARTLWEQGITGAGVDVAIIDTGVAPVAALADEDKIGAVVDLSFESGLPGASFLDGNGHGTHLAGIIAGSDPGGDPATAADRPDEFHGVAPDARLVSLKVADRSGAVFAIQEREVE